MKPRLSRTAHFLGTLTLLILVGMSSNGSVRAQGFSLPFEAVHSRATFPGQAFEIGPNSGAMAR